MANPRSASDDLLSGLSLASLFHGHAAMMLLIDPATAEIVDANPAALEFYGYSKAELLSMRFTDFNTLPPDEVRRGLRRASAVRTASKFAVPHRLASGAIRQVEVHVPPVGANGRDLLLAIIQDVTERVSADTAARRAESERKATLSLLQATLESTADGIMVVDRTGRIVLRNRKFEEIWRLDAAALAETDTHRLRQVVLPQIRDAHAFERTALALYAAPETEHIDVVELKDGRVLQRYSIPQWIGGEVAGRVWSFRDITKEFRSAEALRASEARFRELAENIPYVFYVAPPGAGTAEYVSPAFEKVWGYPLEQLRSNPRLWAETAFAEDRAKISQKIQAQQDGLQDTEYRIVRADGEIRWIYDRSFPVLGPDGTAQRVVGLAQDITERKAAEQQLRLLSLAVEQSPVSVVMSDPSGRIVYVNERYTEITGYSREEALGQHTSLLRSDNLPAGFSTELLSTIRAGRTWRGVIENRKKNGEHFWESVSVSPVLNPEGTITHFLAIKEDVTEKRQLEQQLQQAQKMEAIGRLAGGVAHDFNNLLTGIKGFGTLLRDEIAEGDPRRDDCDAILETADRAAALTRQLLAFSRKQVLQPKVLDLNGVIINLHKMLSRVIGEDVHLETRVSRDGWPVLADAGQIEQVLVNLAVNARDAMPQGGRLEIGTSNVRLAAASPHCVGLVPGDYVQISVRDTGHGIPADVLPHIFEPFYTTKEQGKGTGLGLATAYGIVRQSGGCIYVDTGAGVGTTFRVLLPRTEKTVAAEARTTAPSAAGGRETILLVEDDLAVRTLAERVLRRKGYRVISAANSDSALTLAREHTGTIDLLLTDVVMPRMTGRALADQILELRPGLPILFMSGYSAELAVLDGLRAGERFLPKPFSPEELALDVRSALDRLPAGV